MGCDIHLKVERYDQVTKTWRYVHNPRIKCDYCQPNQKCFWCKGTKRRTVEFWEGRNYDLFAMLANVRNGRGFAGIYTGSGFKPICQPRGIPKDASEHVRKWAEGYGVDGHSHSWHTLKRLKSYNWNQTTTRTGVLSMAQYKDWVKGTRPNEFCGAVEGLEIKTVYDLMADNLLATKPLEELKNYYVRVTWNQTYKQSAGDYWWTRTIPDLEKIAKKAGGDEFVRIVFFFDN